MIHQKMVVLNDILDFIVNHKKNGDCHLKINESYATIKFGQNRFSFFSRGLTYFMDGVSISSIISPIVLFNLKEKIKEYDGEGDSYFCLSEPRDVVNWFNRINLDDIIELRYRLNTGMFSIMESKK